MKLKHLVLILVVCKNTLACTQINASCHDIKTFSGFKFKHECPPGAEIYIHHNETLFGFAKLGIESSVKYSQEFLSVDNDSFTTRNCQDITVQCIVPNGFRNGKSFVKETCVNFKMTDVMKTEPKDLPTILIVILILGSGIVMTVLLCYSWKKYLKLQPQSPSVSKCLRQQLTCSCLRKKGEGEETGIDSKDDDKTPQSLSLEHNLNNERIQSTKDGDTGAHSTSRVSHHRSMNRNLREDPGGVNSSKGKDWELTTRNYARYHDAEDHKTEGQSLLSDQGAAIHSSDMTGEAIPLVNKDSFDPDQVSRCLAAPETDVKSTTGRT